MLFRRGRRGRAAGDARLNEFVPHPVTGSSFDLLMSRVTNLGDAAVTITAAFFLLGCFLWSSRRSALHWMMAVVACGVVTAVGKVALYLHGATLPPFWLASPSGHVAASVLVYGVLPMAASRRRWRWAVLAGGLVALIAVSRVYLQAHTPSDVVVGAGIGGVCLAWFLKAERNRGMSAPARLAMPFAMVFCLLGAAYGVRLHLDRMLHAVAGLVG